MLSTGRRKRKAVVDPNPGCDLHNQALVDASGHSSIHELYVAVQSTDAMNRSEEEEGSRPQSRVRSAFSRSLQRFRELYRRVRGKRKQETQTPTPSTSTPTLPASTINSAPSTSSRPPSIPVPSRSPSINPSPGTPEHHKLSCSLRELYTGSLRILPHIRTTLHPDGTTTTTPHRFKVRILPGWKHGTTVTFHNRGSILHPGHPASDVIYTVEERPHKTFLREGDDLIMRKKVTLVEALTGCAFLVKTLDGRRLSVDVGSVIPVGFEMGIVGEGMPVGGEAGRKGRLRVKFEVEFPKELSVEQKEGLKSVLETDGSATTTGEI